MQKLNTTANNYLNLEKNHVPVGHKPISGRPYNYVFMKGYQGFDPYSQFDAELMKFREKER